MAPSYRKLKKDAKDTNPDLYQGMLGHLVVEPQCKVCRHPMRSTVDMMLATGWSQAATIRFLEAANIENADIPSYNGMSIHKRKHLNINDLAVRNIFEARARAIGMDTEAVEGFITTKEAVAEAIVHTGLASMRSGETVVEPKDMLGAIQLLQQLEARGSETAVDEIMHEFHLFVRAVKKVVPAEMWLEISAIFERDVENKNLTLSVPTAIEAEVTEEEND